MMKLYRTVEEGPNPEVELGRYLAAKGFAHVPRAVGSVDVRRHGRPRATLAIVQAFVPNEGDLWDATKGVVEAFLEDAAAEGEVPAPGSDSEATPLELSGRDAPPDAHRLIGAYLETARLLGERIGQMHNVLAAADPMDPALSPEAFTALHAKALQQSIRARLSDARDLLNARFGQLGPREQAQAAALLQSQTLSGHGLRRLLVVRIGGMRIRVHGDLHLGQVLDVGDDVVIIDFEGEPARPLSERRLKRPALTDLAGMLRSFHYAVHGSLLERLGAASDHEDQHLAAWAAFWYRWVSAACVRGYREATVTNPALPPEDDGWMALLDALLVSKAAYELRYELGSRPGWAGIPLLGLRDLLSTEAARE